MNQEKKTHVVELKEFDICEVCGSVMDLQVDGDEVPFYDCQNAKCGVPQ